MSVLALFTLVKQAMYHMVENVEVHHGEGICQVLWSH